MDVKLHCIAALILGMLALGGIMGYYGYDGAQIFILGGASLAAIFTIIATKKDHVLFLRIIGAIAVFCVTWSVVTSYTMPNLFDEVMHVATEIAMFGAILLVVLFVLIIIMNDNGRQQRSRKF